MLTFLMRSSPFAQTSFTLSLWTVKSVSKASCFFSKPCKYERQSLAKIVSHYLLKIYKQENNLLL